MMRTRLLHLLGIGLLCMAGSACATLLDFENLTQKQDISGTYYENLYWEYGNQGYFNVSGSWMCPEPMNSTDYYYCPASGTNYLTNSWGSTELGIQFLTPVEGFGAYFSGHGFIDNWAEGIRVHGFLGENEVAVTEWFMDIDQTPNWFAINLKNVDRIVIEAKPAQSEQTWYTYGWYGMDDLTYDVIPEPASLILLSLGTLAIKRRRPSR